jgi:pheromone shutdown protein TraB
MGGRPFDRKKKGPQLIAVGLCNARFAQCCQMETMHLSTTHKASLAERWAARRQQNKLRIADVR